MDIMRVNVDKVLERDQKLSELDDRADALQAGASQFETSAAKLKRKYWWKNCKVSYMNLNFYLKLLINDTVTVRMRVFSGTTEKVCSIVVVQQCYRGERLPSQTIFGSVQTIFGSVQNLSTESTLTSKFLAELMFTCY